MTAALVIENLQKNFGALQVTRDVSLTLETGARHALIGPNGAGKTTLINLITGVLQPNAGSIRLHGEEISGLAEEQRVKRGVARTFQINQLFRKLTVLENVVMSVAERTGAVRNAVTPMSRATHVTDEAMSLLETLKLDGDAFTEIRQLPYGRQRLVEIAITLGQKPRVLLLDEPAAGVPSEESHLILDVIGQLSDDISVLIIEHDMDVVFRFANRITVLVGGEVLTEGSPQDIAQDAQVRAVYLGEQLNV